MPRLFINAPYYNLVNNILLNPIYIKAYLGYLILSEFKVDTIFMDDPTPKIFNANNLKFDTMKHSLYNLYYYLMYLDISLTNAERKTLFKVISNNNYKVKDLLYKKVADVYFTEYILIPISKKLAINKIKRNRIYNLGLGLKLSIKAFNKDF
jgi:hypothetical protein